MELGSQLQESPLERAETLPTGGTPDAGPSMVVGIGASASGSDDSQLRQMEEELETTKAQLRGTIDSAKTQQEKLKAANAALQSINEKYRSTLEELETSKEALQSIHEELKAVNQELQGRLKEISQAEAALQQANAGFEQRVAERTATLEQQTQRLRHEMDERQRMQEALFEREKFAALGRLLANVVHELNNPLTVAAWQLDNLQEEGDSSSRAEDLALLRQAVEWCQRVVQSFLSLAQHLRLPTPANADRSQVAREVSDREPGIPQEVQRRLADFLTTQPQGMGSGLDLPLCRSMVDGHGGTAPLASEPGHGTTVSVTLPASASEVPVQEAVPEPVEPAHPASTFILLIDDEAGVQHSLRRVLQRSGYAVTTATTGQEGLAALEKHSYAVILCDMRMPDLDGPGFYRELGRRQPHLLSRIIFLTGDVLSPAAQDFFVQVDNVRLVKPFRGQEVRRVIQQMLEAR